MKKETVSWTIISGMRKSRDEFADKRAFGHALLAVGSKGMMGAAVLSAGAALKSGCGLVTAHIPEGERMIMHVSNSSAIVDCDPGDVFTGFTGDLSRYTAVGIGCGLIVRQGGSSGGDDALALVISRVTGLRLSKCYLATDLSVLALSLSYIPVLKIACSLVTVTLSSFLIDWVVGFGRRSAEDGAPEPSGRTA